MYEHSQTESTLFTLLLNSNDISSSSFENTLKYRGNLAFFPLTVSAIFKISSNWTCLNKFNKSVLVNASVARWETS